MHDKNPSNIYLVITSCRPPPPTPPPVILPPGVPVSRTHGIINYVDTKPKCRHLKKLTCKGTLRQVFISLWTGDTVSHVDIFLPSFVNCYSLDQLSPPLPPSLCESILYTRIQCVRGVGYGVLGLRQIKTCRKVSLHANFFR